MSETKRQMIACVFADGRTRWATDTTEAQRLCRDFGEANPTLRDDSSRWLSGFVAVDLTEEAYQRVQRSLRGPFYCCHCGGTRGRSCKRCGREECVRGRVCNGGCECIAADSGAKGGQP